MRTIEVQICKFDELSEEMQKKVLEKNRTWNVDDTWWYECVYENFKEEAKELGFEVERIYFSGFWSQGDGAMFEGTINLKDYLKATNQHPRIQSVCDNFYCDRIDFAHRGQYCHENSFNNPNELQVSHQRDLMRLTDLVDELNSEIISKYKEICRKLYRDLEKEYDYQTSDEAIKESLIANDYEFDEDGDIVY